MMKLIGLTVWLIAAALSAAAPEPNSAPAYGLFEPGQCYTWGINPRLMLPLKGGQMITDAVFTIHQIRPAASDSNESLSGSTPRSELRLAPDSEQEDFEDQALWVYVLDNPRFGFLPLKAKTQQDDPFARFGGVLSAQYQDGDLIYRLSQTHDPNGWTAQVFGDRPALTLADGTAMTLSSALLEFIDYAGTGRSVGFGMRCGGVRYCYDDITLQITVQSFRGGAPDQTIVCHIADEVLPDNAYVLTVNAENGRVNLSPDKPVYLEGQTVTLIAAADDGYTFSGWSGGLTGKDNPVTITMNQDLSVTANFTKPSRSSQRGR